MALCEEKVLQSWAQGRRCFPDKIRIKNWDGPMVKNRSIEESGHFRGITTGLLHLAVDQHPQSGLSCTRPQRQDMVGTGLPQ